MRLSRYPHMLLFLYSDTPCWLALSLSPGWIGRLRLLHLPHVELSVLGWGLDALQLDLIALGSILLSRLLLMILLNHNIIVGRCILDFMRINDLRDSLSWLNRISAQTPTLLRFGCVAYLTLLLGNYETVFNDISNILTFRVKFATHFILTVNHLPC